MPPTALTDRRRQIAWELLCIGVLVSICLAIGLPRFRSNIDMQDEGFLAYGAERVMEGQTPNLDFVSMQPPLSFYTVAAAFQLFGTSLLSMRVMGLGIQLLIVLLVYGIARNFVSRALSLAAAIPATVLGMALFHYVPYAVWQGNAATALAIFLYLTAIRREPPRGFGVAAGVVTAASLLLRQDQGLYAVLSIAAFTWILKRQRGRVVPAFVGWLMGLALALLPCGIYWLAKGAVPEMFKQLVIAPTSTYAKTSSLPFPMLHSLSTPGQVGVFLYYLPPIVQFVAAIALWKRNCRGVWGWNEAGGMFLLAWSVFYYCQVLTRTDKYHLLVTLTPFFILCVWGWNLVLQKVQAKSGKYFLSGAAGVVALGFLCFVGPIFLATDADAQSVPLARAGIRCKGGAAIGDFVRAIDASAPVNRSILCLPYEPMYYFLSARRNPTRWNYLWPGDQTAQDHAMLIEEARRDPPALVLVFVEPEMRDYAIDILDYIHTDFKKLEDASGCTVYKPK